MKCDFCGREVEERLTECPYCHYQLKKETQVLSPDERDTFEGITIEEDGSTSSSDKTTRADDSYRRGYDSSRQAGPQPHFKVKTVNINSGILMTLLIIGGILALFFFLLPAFLIFAAVGAVIVFLLKLFM